METDDENSIEGQITKFNYDENDVLKVKRRKCLIIDSDEECSSSEEVYSNKKTVTSNNESSDSEVNTDRNEHVSNSFNDKKNRSDEIQLGLENNEKSSTIKLNETNQGSDTESEDDLIHLSKFRIKPVNSDNDEEPLLISKTNVADSDSDEDAILISKTKRNIADSDSDEEAILISKTKRNIADSDSDEDAILISKTKRNITDSDSDEDAILISKTNRNIADSDSDEDAILISKTKRNIADSDSDEELLNDKVGQLTKIKPVEYDPDIYDQEISDDNDADAEGEDEVVKSKPCKKKDRAASEKARGAIVQEIYCEKQRMIRDTEISLPYHKPKQRTVKEFLARKKYIPTSKMSLKMSMKDVRLLKDIEDRQKELETFYKSESEEEDEQNVDDSCNLQINSTICESPKENCDSDVACSSVNDHDSANAIGMKTIVGGEILGSDDLIDLREQTETDHTLENNECKQDTKEAENETEVINNTDSDEESLKLDMNDSAEEMETKYNKPQDKAIEDMICTEDLDLHLDSEDITEMEQSKSMKDIVPKVPSIGNTPKLTLLASRFPDININEIANTTPKIGMQAGSFIEFDDSPKKASIGRSDVDELLERLVRSASTKKPVKKTDVFLDIVQKEKDSNGEENLVASSICVKLQDQQPKEINTVPGSQLVRLKNQLKVSLLKNRERERQRRVKEKQFLDCEEVITDYHDDLPDEEADMTDQSDTDVETESEPEENDILVTDSKKPRNPYIDDEADESEDTDGNSDDNDVEDTIIDNIESNCNIQDGFESESDGEVYTRPKEHKSRLVILSDDEDSNDKAISDTENLSLFYDESMDVDMVKSKESNSEKTKDDTMSMQQPSRKRFSNELEESFNSMDSSLELVGSVMPPHQPYGGQKKRKCIEKSTMSPPDSKMTFFTQLLNAKPIAEENSYDFSLSQFGDPHVTDKKSPNSEIKTSTTKSAIDSNDYDLLGLCSGKFAETQNTQAETNVSKALPERDEIIGLCSGIFSTQAETNVSKALPERDEIIGLCSGIFSTQAPLTMAEQEDDLSLSALPTGSCPNHAIPEESFVSRSWDDVPFPTRSETADVQKEDLCLSTNPTDSKSAVESSSNSPKSPQSLDLPTAVVSSDEEGILDRQGDRKSFKRKRRVYTFSDEDNDESDNEDEIRPKKKFTGFKDKVKGGIRHEFLDAEAELSGSDFDSADEDEPDEANDIMEQEEGDLETFDEDMLRDEVGKAHMKSMIDKDKRELRILKELYFEDGDLHGQGRQRQFRWKNLSTIEETAEQQSGSEEGEDDDPQEETERRKERIEREKFIQDSNQDDDVTISINNSTRTFVTNNMKAGRQSSKENVSHNSSCSVFGSVTNHGSFLSHGQSSLKALAVLTKENHTIGGVKQGGNFVFQRLSAEEAEQRKEKASSKTIVPKDKVVRPNRSFFSLDEKTRSTSVFKHL